MDDDLVAQLLIQRAGQRKALADKIGMEAWTRKRGPDKINKRFLANTILHTESMNRRQEEEVCFQQLAAHRQGERLRSRSRSPRRRSTSRSRSRSPVRRTRSPAHSRSRSRSAGRSPARRSSRYRSPSSSSASSSDSRSGTGSDGDTAQQRREYWAKQKLLAVQRAEAFSEARAAGKPAALGGGWDDIVDLEAAARAVEKAEARLKEKQEKKAKKDKKHKKSKKHKKHKH